jgi:hypothetical protein
MVGTSQNKKENSKRVESGGEMGEASQPQDAELSKEVAAARLCEAYRVAAERGSFVFDPPLDASLLIGSKGTTQIVFPRGILDSRMYLKRWVE